MAYIYEMIEIYIGDDPGLLHNWMFQDEKFCDDDGKSPFILEGFDEKEHKGVPMYKLRRHGYIKGITVKELLKELTKGREHGTKYLDKHGISTPTPQPVDAHTNGVGVSAEDGDKPDTIECPTCNGMGSVVKAKHRNGIDHTSCPDCWGEGRIPKPSDTPPVTCSGDPCHCDICKRIAEGTADG